MPAFTLQHICRVTTYCIGRRPTFDVKHGKLLLTCLHRLRIRGLYRFEIRKNSFLYSFLVWSASADVLLISCSVDFVIYCKLDWCEAGESINERIFELWLCEFYVCISRLNFGIDILWHTYTRGDQKVLKLHTLITRMVKSNLSCEVNQVLVNNFWKKWW